MPPTGHQGTPEVTAVPRAGKCRLGPWRFTLVVSRVHRALLSPRGTGGSRRLAETRADLEGKERQPLQAEGWALATGLPGLPVSPFLPHATLGPSSGAVFSEAGPPPPPTPPWVSLAFPTGVSIPSRAGQSLVASEGPLRSPTARRPLKSQM